MLEDYSFSPQSAGDGSPSDVFHDHGGPSQCVQPDYFGRFFESSECKFLKSVSRGIYLGDREDSYRAEERFLCEVAITREANKLR